MIALVRHYGRDRAAEMLTQWAAQMKTTEQREPRGRQHARGLSLALLLLLVWQAFR